MKTEYIIRDEMIEQTKARVVLGAPKFNAGLKAAIEVATNIPAADVVVKPKWISVKERLPEDEQRVLVCYRYKARDGRLCENQHLLIASYNCFDPHPHWDHENSPYGITVTHWMPLPEPPEEET